MRKILTGISSLVVATFILCGCGSPKGERCEIRYNTEDPNLPKEMIFHGDINCYVYDVETDTTLNTYTLTVTDTVRHVEYKIISDKPFKDIVTNIQEKN